MRRTKEETTDQTDIEVFVVRAPGKKKSVILNGHRTVLDALREAGLVKKDSEIIAVDGEEIDEDEYDSLVLSEGQRVSLVRNVEGGRA